MSGRREGASGRRAAVVGIAAVLPTAVDGVFRVEREDPGLARVRRQMSRGAYLAALAVHDILGGGDPEAACGGRDPRVKVDPAQTAAFLALGASNGVLDDVLRILAAATAEGGEPRLDVERFARRGVAACNPLLAFQLMNNFTLCHAAIREGLQGPSGAFFGTPAGAAHALREGLRALDEVPWAIVGAADSLLHPVTRFERAQAAGAAEGSATSTESLATIPGEGAIVLLLARDAAAPIAWVELEEELSAADDVDAAPAAPAAPAAHAAPAAPAAPDPHADLGAANPALAWWRAVEGIRAGGEGALVGGVRFRRERPEAPAPRCPTPPAPRRPTPPRHAVITGVGATSAYGVGVEALWDGLLGGVPAIGLAAHLPGFPPVGAVPDGELLSGVPRAARAAWAERGWLRDRRLAPTVSAALQAWDAAGRPDGLALSLALGLEQAWLEDFLPLGTPDGLDWARDPGGPALRYRAPLDLPARALAEVLPLLPAAGATLVHASACAGGALAVAQAAAWVTAGEADRVLCGGGDSMLNPLGMAGLQKLGVLSPKRAGRPFDLRRDGIVVGEGAACFVVEEEGAARRRGAPILARIAGWGNTQDGYAPTAPRPGGAPARRAMAAALARAGVAPEDVAYVNAHGTGTPLNDEAESTAILDLLPPDVPVGSFKGAIGHAMAAAGALELAGCLVAFARGVIPGTAGFETPDPRCPVAVVRNARAFDGRFVLSNSFGFGGQDASVLLAAP